MTAAYRQVAYIQKKDFPLYAQQVTSMISLAVVLVEIVYINTVIKKLKKNTDKK